MSSPAISVLLPVYNSEQFLAATIESILAQTFNDFELLIINDGSTDYSVEVINSYYDPRIKFINNPVNKGLISTLNEGVSRAQGRFIARIDGDDTAAPTRFQQQHALLESDPSLALVACTVVLINEKGDPAGVWQTDRDTITYGQIKAKMPWENCIAHPSVLIRADIAKKYLYNANQVHTEDYDLWLRILADGHRIEKINEPLLFYRVHEQSITGSILRKSNPFLKQFRCKKKFLQKRISQNKWGHFENRVLITTVYDKFMGIAKNIKNRLPN